MKWNGEEGQSVGIKMKDNIKVNKSRFSGLVVHGLPLASQKENEREEADWKMERKHKKEALKFWVYASCCVGERTSEDRTCVENWGGGKKIWVCAMGTERKTFSACSIKPFSYRPLVRTNHWKLQGGALIRERWFTRCGLVKPYLFCNLKTKIK